MICALKGAKSNKKRLRVLNELLTDSEHVHDEIVLCAYYKYFSLSC